MIQYIFCISPGRCGTDYLTALFRCARNTWSTHEALPIMNGTPMIAFNRLDEEPLRVLTDLKWDTIQSRQRGRVYCETNHSFIKGWGWLVPDRLAPQEQIGVVVLRRHRDENALSLLRIRDVPGISEFSRTWYLEPDAARNLDSPQSGAGLFELCQWYIDETYRRGQAYRDAFPGIRYFECELSQLNEPAFVERMFAFFDLTATPELAAVVGRPLNTKEYWPRWTKEQLLDLPSYANPDDWLRADRDSLLAELVSWLRQQQAHAISSMQPDPALFGSLSTAIPKVVADAEVELERTFQIRLRFTETERLLMGELLYSLNPRDFAFLALERRTQPYIAHHYDFNFELTLKRVYQRLGLVGLSAGLLAMARGRWRRDPSHTAAER